MYLSQLRSSTFLVIYHPHPPQISETANRVAVELNGSAALGMLLAFLSENPESNTHCWARRHVQPFPHTCTYCCIQCCQQLLRAPELCESRSGCPWLPDLISPMVSVDVKHHVYQSVSELRSCVKAEVPVPNRPYGLRGRKATLNTQYGQSSGAV